MYYKIDLNNYKPKKTRIYLDFSEYKFSPYQLEAIENELNNFQDSFGKPWREWDLSDLKYRLENNWTFYLIGNGREGLPLPAIEGWAFIDWNKRYPMLCQKYVCPKYRGTGLNLELIWIRCNELSEQGYKTAMMFIDDWNEPAKSVLKEKIFTKME